MSPKKNLKPTLRYTVEERTFVFQGYKIGCVHVTERFYSTCETNQNLMHIKTKL